MRSLLLGLAFAAGSAFGQTQIASIDAVRAQARVQSEERAQAMDAARFGDYKPILYLAALRGIAGGGGGSVSISGTPTAGQCASWTNATTIQGVDCATLVGTPAAGDISYWTSSSAQALLTAASGSTGAYLRSAGTGAAPIWSTLILPNASTSGGVLYSSAANTVASSGALTANALMIGGGAGAAPSTTTTGTGILTALGINTGSAGAPVLFNGAGGTPSSLTLTNATGLPVAGGGTGGTSVQTATQALSTPRILYKQGLPMIVMSSGTMTSSGSGDGNFTGLTALTVSGIPPHAYCYMPAGSVNASGGGSTAGWYYCTFATSSTGRVYNNAYDPTTGVPPTIPGSPTSPTTATSWTGITAGVTAIQFSVPANSMGANGFLRFPMFYFTATNNANAKSYNIALGAFNAASALSVANVGNMTSEGYIANYGSTAGQMALFKTAANTLQNPLFGTVDTTSAANLVVTLTKGTATDNLMLLNFEAILDSNGS